MGQSVPVLVSVNPADPNGLERVASDLRAAGVNVTDVLEAIGTITGICPEDRVAELSKIPGVMRVARGGGVAIPPPSSPIQ